MGFQAEAVTFANVLSSETQGACEELKEIRCGQGLLEKGGWKEMRFPRVVGAQQGMPVSDVKAPEGN